MPKRQLLLNDFSGGLNTYQVPRDLKINEFQSLQNFTFQKRGTLIPVGTVSTHSTVPTQAATIVGGFGLFTFESDYSPVTYEAVDTSQSTNIVFVNDSGEGLNSTTSAGTFNGRFLEAGNIVHSAEGSSGIKETVESNLFEGMQIAVSGTVSNNGIFEVRGVGDSVNLESDGGAVNAIEIVGAFANETIAANSTSVGPVSIKTHALGENILLLSDVTNGTVDVYSKSTDAFVSSEITTKNTSTAIAAAITPEYSFYAVDNAVRVSDGKKISASQKIKWYGYVSRDHFPGLQNSSVPLSRDGAGLYTGWFSEDNDLKKPTVARTDTSDTFTTANAGFAINYTNTVANDNSEWTSETYVIALSFIYDDNQESLLFIPTSNHTFNSVSGNELTIKVLAQKTLTASFGARVSGGRLYYKPADNLGEPWTLLVDINLSDGVASSVTGDRTVWTAATTTRANSAVTILKPNIDTYDSINGYSPDIQSNSIGTEGESWKTAVITNRRAFVANVKIKSPSTGVIESFSDRLMYSMPNKFDTFPSFNFIDVVKGDAESYVKLESFSDRLLAYKQHSVQFINISSPSDTNWFLEADIKDNGVLHPAAVFRSSIGVLWANKKGMFYYDGSAIKNIMEDKIDQSEWASFITNFSVVGYDGNSNMAMVVRDSENSGAAQGDAYIFDFKTGSWSFVTDLLTASAGKYTNFITDYDGNLSIGVQSSGNILTQTFSYNNVDTKATGLLFAETKDIDFGSPAINKKIYAVTITYKSDSAQTKPIHYATNGSTSFSNFFIGDFIATGNVWKKLRAFVTTPITCQSIAIQVSNKTAASGTTYGIQVSDISIEYRTIGNDRVTSDT